MRVYTRAVREEKYPVSEWPWNVCTTAGRLRGNASMTATRPSVPPFAACVCTRAGRSRRAIRTSSASARASPGPGSRRIDATSVGWTPMRWARSSIVPSSALSLPRTSRVA